MSWKYAPGDVIMTSGFGGLKDHWGIVVSNGLDEYGQPLSWVFDTTWTRGFSAYTTLAAFEDGNGSTLKLRPDPVFVPVILQRIESVIGVPYSILKKTDCESLVRWVIDGENWSGQVVSVIGTVACSIVIAAIVGNNRPTRRNRRP